MGAVPPSERERYDAWWAEIERLFDAVGGPWTGYGAQLRESMDERDAYSLFDEGISAEEMVESEFDAAE